MGLMGLMGLVVYLNMVYTYRGIGESTKPAYPKRVCKRNECLFNECKNVSVYWPSCNRHAIIQVSSVASDRRDVCRGLSICPAEPPSCSLCARLRVV